MVAIRSLANVRLVDRRSGFIEDGSVDIRYLAICFEVGYAVDCDLFTIGRDYVSFESGEPLQEMSGTAVQDNLNPGSSSAETGRTSIGQSITARGEGSSGTSQPASGRPSLKRPRNFEDPLATWLEAELSALESDQTVLPQEDQAARGPPASPLVTQSVSERVQPVHPEPLKRGRPKETKWGPELIELLGLAVRVYGRKWETIRRVYPRLSEFTGLQLCSKYRGEFDQKKE
jgi:hypothetical protein